MSAKVADGAGSEKPERKDKKTKHENEFALNCYPAKDFLFKGPFNDVVTSSLSLFNPLEKTVAFKVMVTQPKHYCCRPPVGYVRPGETFELQIMVEPMNEIEEKKIEAEKHKFMIQAIVVEDSNKKSNSTSQDTEVESADDLEKKSLPPAAQFWAMEHSKRDLMFAKFPVVFLQANVMNKEQVEATIRELTTKAAMDAAAEMDCDREKDETDRKEREILMAKNLKTEAEKARLEFLVAEAQITLAKERITGILKITPYDGITFKGPFTDYTGAVLRMQNMSDKNVYYKVLSTNPRNYVIKPNNGILKPSEMIVCVLLLEHNPEYARIEAEFAKGLESVCLKDNILVHAAYSPNAQTPIPSFWKNLDAGQLQVKKIKIFLNLITREDLAKEQIRKTKVVRDMAIKRDREKNAKVEFMEDNIDERILRLAPLHEIVYNAPYNRTQDTYLQIFNPSDRLIYYKVFATVPKLYSLKPTFGMLKAHQGIGVAVRLDSVTSLMQLCEGVHKIVVQAVYHTVDSEDFEKFWKTVDNDIVKLAHVRVTFHGLPSNFAGVNMRRKKKKKTPGDIKVHLDPDKEIIFKGPFNTITTSPVCLYNDTDKFVYYKVMINVSQHYAVKPNQGIVPPHKLGVMSFMLEALADWKSIPYNTHKVVVQVQERDKADIPAKAFWIANKEKPNVFKLNIGYQDIDPLAPPIGTAAAAHAIAANNQYNAQQHQQQILPVRLGALLPQVGQVGTSQQVGSLNNQNTVNIQQQTPGATSVRSGVPHQQIQPQSLPRAIGSQMSKPNSFRSSINTVQHQSSGVSVSAAAGTTTAIGQASDLTNGFAAPADGGIVGAGATNAPAICTVSTGAVPTGAGAANAPAICTVSTGAVPTGAGAANAPVICTTSTGAAPVGAGAANAPVICTTSTDAAPTGTAPVEIPLPGDSPLPDAVPEAADDAPSPAEAMSERVIGSVYDTGGSAPSPHQQQYQSYNNNIGPGGQYNKNKSVMMGPGVGFNQGSSGYALPNGQIYSSGGVGSYGSRAGSGSNGNGGSSGTGGSVGGAEPTSGGQAAAYQGPATVFQHGEKNLNGSIYLG